MKLKLYHYSVETFQAADDELIGDYKHQYLVYEPYIICLLGDEPDLTDMAVLAGTGQMKNAEISIAQMIVTNLQSLG